MKKQITPSPFGGLQESIEPSFWPPLAKEKEFLDCIFVDQLHSFFLLFTSSRFWSSPDSLSSCRSVLCAMLCISRICFGDTFFKSQIERAFSTYKAVRSREATVCVGRTFIFFACKARKLTSAGWDVVKWKQARLRMEKVHGPEWFLLLLPGAWGWKNTGIWYFCLNQSPRSYSARLMFSKHLLSIHLWLLLQLLAVLVHQIGIYKIPYDRPRTGDPGVGEEKGHETSVNGGR